MIIDSHVHIGEFLDSRLTPEDVIYSMDTYRIDYSIVSSVSGVEYDHDLKEIPLSQQISQIDCLNECLVFARKYPNRIGVAAWSKPHTEGVTDEYRKLVADNIDIIKAVKLHAYHNKTAVDSSGFLPYLELAREFNLPVVVHTGGCNEAEPVTVYNAAKKHPDINFVMVHMGLGSDNRSAVGYASELPNLYGDTTWVPVKSTLELIKKAGSQKIVFGSDNPVDGKDTYLCNMNGDRSLYQEYFNEFKAMVSTDDFENIMWRNAVRLFRINL